MTPAELPPAEPLTVEFKSDQATRLLERMVKAGQLEAVGVRRWRVYCIPGTAAEGGTVV